MTRLLLEETPLCVRAARVEGDEVTALRHYFPGREAPQLGALYRARVTEIDKRLGAAYLDLGGADGFLRRSGPLPEVGRSLLVEVRREAIGGKGADVSDRPALRLPAATLLMPGGEMKPGPLSGEGVPEFVLPDFTEGGAPGLIDPLTDGLRLLMSFLDSDVEMIGVTRTESRAALLPLLPEGFPVEMVSPRDVTPFLDQTEEDGLARVHGLPGGGRIAIDETEALFAVDLDLGAQGGQSKKGAGTKLLGDALTLLGRLGPVMGLGGQIVIDIPRGAIAAPKIVRDQITRALKPLGRVSVPAVTPEGLSIVIAPRPRPSLREMLTEPGIDPFPGRRFRADQAAAMAWRAAETALNERKSDRVTLFVTNRVRPCLEGSPNPLQILQERYGARLVLADLPEDDPRGDFHVD